MKEDRKWYWLLVDFLLAIMPIIIMILIITLLKKLVSMILHHNLSEDEWREYVTLEYVLTWGYTHEYEKDYARFKELQIKEYPQLKNH